MVQHCILT